MVSPVYIRPLLALLVMVAIIGIATFIFRNGSHESAPARSYNQQLPHNIDVALKKALFSEMQDGLVVWELTAERADYDKTGDLAYLTDIKMEFKHNKSRGAVTVTADKGEYASAAKNIKLNGHVHVLAEDGASFKTSSIVYTGAKEMFTTPDTVVFQQDRLQLTAIGFNYNVSNSKAHFISLVDALITSK